MLQAQLTEKDAASQPSPKKQKASLDKISLLEKITTEGNTSSPTQIRHVGGRFAYIGNCQDL